VAARPSHVDRLAVGGVRRLHHRFGHRRVGVHGAHQLLVGPLHLQGDAGLGDQVGGVGAEDVHPARRACPAGTRCAATLEG